MDLQQQLQVRLTFELVAADLDPRRTVIPNGEAQARQIIGPLQSGAREVLRRREADAQVGNFICTDRCQRNDGVETLVEMGPDVDFSKSRSEEHTSELQSLMRHSYAVFCL